MSVKDLVICSWNCRGMNNALSRESIKSCCRSIRANLLFLQETKCSTWDACFENQIWSNDVHNWLVQNSTGHSGGLACSWNKGLFKCTSFAQSRHWIWIQFKSVQSQELFNVVNIYSPHDLKGERTLWDDLKQICHFSTSEPICLVGDFNYIRNEFERKNCEYCRNDFKGFEYFISDNNLFDLVLNNTLFTWFGSNGKCSKLDRFLVNDKWMEVGSW